MRKRRLLNNKPQGEYICFIDDDDQFTLPKESVAIRFRKWLNTFRMPRPLAFFNWFKWFRRLCSGTWYLNHYSFVMPGDGFRRWEREECMRMRSYLVKKETYSLSEYEPSFPFHWLTKFEWFREYCGGTWYYNRYWWDMGRECVFLWERHYAGSGGPKYTVKQENYL